MVVLTLLVELGIELEVFSVVVEVPLYEIVDEIELLSDFEVVTDVSEELVLEMEVVGIELEELEEIKLELMVDDLDDELLVVINDEEDERLVLVEVALFALRSWSGKESVVPASAAAIRVIEKCISANVLVNESSRQAKILN